jgi:hypothetical protein
MAYTIRDSDKMKLQDVVSELIDKFERARGADPTESAFKDEFLSQKIRLSSVKSVGSSRRTSPLDDSQEPAITPRPRKTRGKRKPKQEDYVDLSDLEDEAQAEQTSQQESPGVEQEPSPEAEAEPEQEPEIAQTPEPEPQHDPTEEDLANEATINEIMAEQPRRKSTRAKLKRPKKKLSEKMARRSQSPPHEEGTNYPVVVASSVTSRTFTRPDSSHSNRSLNTHIHFTQNQGQDLGLNSLPQDKSKPNSAGSSPQKPVIIDGVAHYSVPQSILKSKPSHTYFSPLGSGSASASAPGFTPINALANHASVNETAVKSNKKRKAERFMEPESEDSDQEEDIPAMKKAKAGGMGKGKGKVTGAVGTPTYSRLRS